MAAQSLYGNQATGGASSGRTTLGV
jgi:hypothetical protein